MTEKEKDKILEQRIEEYKRFHFYVLKLWIAEYMKDPEYNKIMDRLNMDYKDDIEAYSKKYNLEG